MSVSTSTACVTSSPRACLCAILDVMSKGRLEVAFPLGTGMEYWAHPVNPATARDKFKEVEGLSGWRFDDCESNAISLPSAESERKVERALPFAPSPAARLTSRVSFV